MSRIAFLFPGQGAQHVGMGQSLVELPAARALIDRARDVLGYDLAQVCFEGPAEKLDSTVYSQPALFVTSLAALEQLKANSPDIVEKCEAAAGLSLGEYTAMVFAGVMDFETGLNVVRQRGEAMKAAADATPSGMVSILGLEADKLQLLCDESRLDDEVLQIANYLCPGNIVISGSLSACEHAAAAAERHGAMKAIPLAVAGAFHTPIMQPAVEKLSAALAGAKLNNPRLPVVSNVDAKPHDDPEEIRELLIKQVVSPVQWEASMRYLLEQGFRTYYEVGPKRVLCGLMKRIDRKAACEATLG
jgi:[acyl-carrier-protein] S-malonyltransferase